MITRHYEFAGIAFTISMPAELMFADAGRLAPFAVESVTDPHVFTYERVSQLKPPEGICVTTQSGLSVYRNGDCTIRYSAPERKNWESAYFRTEHRGKHHAVQLRADEYPGRLGTNTVLETMAAEHLIARNNGVVFHCSYIDWEGRAILFTAPSETGKSTQADLWHRYRGARIINGDRGVIRLAEGKLLAEGIPFSGSSHFCENCSLPLGAIVYLGQAPRTTIRPMRGYEAFSRIWEGCSVNTWDKVDVELASEVVRQAAEQIPVFHLPCTPDESAVIALEQALRKLVNE